ncbi:MULTISPECIES: helix-turn-helix domain-containing protein [Bacillus cereus group]|uniref:helix-turn-helix domain-containing protein n=1 Tax=Bacillus cereus group TaxID=86661 RepID=UPI0018F72992|nr:MULTISPECIES: helix-turn-helix transcriptional regulator [Bacillus cereus group]MBJ7937857.1 helix-turn-helix transcriptional regulator [Bacillus cereus]MCA1042947.1 helix-turn-helix domain-containing protein [Bacillus toyonensis]MEB8805769.1 helix-turn-helix transcriptional regulator [Bacillus cereus]
MDILGDRIRHLRELNNLSQKKLADALGLTNTQLSRYERGERSPEPETIKLIADYFDVTTDYLHGRINNPNYSHNDFKDVINDSELGLWFKDIQNASPDKREELKRFWDFIKVNEKKNKVDSNKKTR